MRFTFIIIIASICLFSISQPSLIAQTKGETKLYDRTISKGTIKDYNRFIAKYPNSKYADEIVFRRDSVVFYSIEDRDIISYISFFKENPTSRFYPRAISKVESLSVSGISRDNAEKIFRETVPEDFDKVSFRAVPIKSIGKDYIIAVVREGEGSFHYRLYKLKLSSGEWTVVNLTDEKRYIQFEELSSFYFRSEMLDVSIQGRKYVQFSYDNFTPYSLNNSPTVYQPRPFLREYVTALFDVESGVLYSAMFSGVEQKTKDVVIIEGVSMDADVNKLQEVPEMTYLLDYISNQSFLEPISQENLISDETVRWWYKNNRKGAKSLKFGTLPENSSIVKEYRLQKDIKKSRLYNAALFDFRGNTLVVIYQKSTKEYILLWSEPQAIDKDKDLLLNTIYFENQNVLALFYYEGRKTDKKRLNIGDRRLY